MRTDELDYELPPGCIATHPAEPRDSSRLMVVMAGPTASPLHARFRDLLSYLRAGDLLVVNETRVLPAKLELHKESGAFIPGLFVAEIAVGEWEVMLRSRGKVDVGSVLIGGGYRLELLRRISGEKGMWQVGVTPAREAAAVLAEIGHVPLPPYIEKQRVDGGGGEEAADREAYQTVYAREGASLAAPTAGLHFTPELLARIEAMGVRRVAVELTVGLGTFLPVEAETLEAHRMHEESYRVPASTAAAIREQRGRGGRIVVVGTTAVRTLEAAAERILAGEGDIVGVTDLKILPGYRFRLTDALITNFHLPRSTLMALVAAKLGKDGVARLKTLYGEAIREGYRFYSYGDAMLILPGE